MAKYRISINTKLIFVLLIIGIPITFSFMYYLNKTVLAGFEEIENRRVITILDQIEGYLENQVQEKSSKLNDWAKWDDAHLFVQGKKSDFVYSNLRNPENVFPNLKADFVAFNDINGRFLYGKSFDFNKNDYDSKFENILSFLKTLKPGHEYSGYAIDPVTKEVFIYVSLYTTNTDLSAKPSGNMIGGKYIDEAFLKQLEEVTKFKVQILPPAGKETVHKVSDNLIRAQRDIIHKNQDKAYFSIALEMDRPVHLIFLSIYKTLQIALITSILLFVFLIYFLINRNMIHRLKSIIKWVSDFEETKSYKPLPITHNDELSDLIHAMNQMAQSIQKYSLEIEEKNQKFALSSKMAAIGTMASDLTGDINTPLNDIMINMNELLSKHKDDSETVAKLSRVQEHTIHITNVIKSLTDFATKADTVVTEVEFSLKQVIEDAVEMSRANLKKNNIDIRIKNLEDATIKGSGLQLNQVLMNLINNSRDAIINNREKWIEISISKSFSNLLEIKVTDSGNGIPSEVVDKMMEPFYTTKINSRGNGLGLSISKGLVESLGGALYYDDTSKHTCFIIEIPYTNALNQKAS